MSRSRLVLIVATSLVIAIPTVLLLRKKKMGDELEYFLDQNGFTKENSCIITDPIIERPSQLVCYRGKVGGVGATLILASKFRPGYVPNATQVALDSYVGLLLNAPNDPEWLSSWQRQVANRGDGWAKLLDWSPSLPPNSQNWGPSGPPDSIPIRATRVGDQTLLAWKGLWSKDVAKSRIDSISSTIPASWKISAH